MRLFRTCREDYILSRIWEHLKGAKQIILI